jgi:hypothetical protein
MRPPREPARLLLERGAEATLIQADVAKPADISRMFAEAGWGIDSLGIFATMSASAGVAPLSGFGSHDGGTWRPHVNHVAVRRHLQPFLLLGQMGATAPADLISTRTPLALSVLDLIAPAFIDSTIFQRT